MGERSNTIDMAGANSQSGELAYMRGADGVGNVNNFTPAFVGTKHRASGGNTSYMVGEQGPELFTPEVPGTIKPADESGAQGSAMNANIQIHAIDAKGVEEVLINQRGNIITMLRDAANQHGENFMESVQAESLT